MPSARLTLILILTMLFGVELMFLPMPGIQYDEVLFALPFLNGHSTLYSWGGVPVMLMDYIGASKTWIYWPIFKLWPVGMWSVRLPVCLLSVVTAALFAGFTRRVAGARAGLFAAALLATDAPFLLTNVFDWGPVCLLLLAMAAFLSLMHRFFATGNRLHLASAMFVAGLATWYKPLFLVPLAALAAAWLIVYGGKMARGAAFTATAAFLLGASPLVAFNAQRGFATIAASHDLPAVPVAEKLLMMRRTLDGRALEHYMFRSYPGERIALAGASLGVRAEGWYRQTSFHPGSFLLPALLLSLLALPFLRTSGAFRPLCVAWIALVLAFGAMVLFRDAGAGPHHTALLDPAPQFIVAITAVAVARRVRRREIPVLLVLTIVASNLWLLGQYARAGRRNGFSVYWSDGIAELTRQIESRHLPVAFLDRGIENGVQTLSRNRVFVVAPLPLRAGVLYVTHCGGYVIDNSRAQPDQASKARIVTDRQGAPVFCVFRTDTPMQ